MILIEKLGLELFYYREGKQFFVWGAVNAHAFSTYMLKLYTYMAYIHVKTYI